MQNEVYKMLGTASREVNEVASFKNVWLYIITETQKTVSLIYPEQKVYIVFFYIRKIVLFAYVVFRV